MNYEFNGSPQEIEKQIEQIRSDFSDNVQNLCARIQPKALVQDAKVQAQAKFYQARKFATDTWQGALDGDRVSQRNLAFAVAGTVASAGLLVWRIARR